MKLQLILPLLLLIGARTGSADVPDAVAPRVIQLTCSVAIRDIPTGTQSANVWIPVPRSDAGQAVSDQAILDGVPYRMRTDVRTGNRFLCFTLPVSQITTGKPITATFTIEQAFQPGPLATALPASFQPGHGGPPPLAHVIQASFQPGHGGPPPLTPFRQVLLLRPGPSSRTVDPVPEAQASPDFSALRRLFLDQDQGTPVAFVRSGDNRNMRWHANFITDLQALGIQARFVTGLVLRDEGTVESSPGIHHWAEFLCPDQGWLPVSVLLGDGFGRPLVLSTGRDVTAPGSAGGPVSFFNGPLVELDGQVHHDVETAWTARKINPDRVMLAQK